VQYEGLCFPVRVARGDFHLFARLEFLRETFDIEKFLELSLTSRELTFVT
jgi:hypothetical protein